MKPTALIFLAVLVGCASSGIAVIDVTTDARFQAGYRAGQVWRLRTDGYVVQSRDNGLELWTSVEGTGQLGAVKVPAGSTVRIERLGYLFNPDHPPVPGGTMEMVWAYGTLTDPSGGHWTVAVLSQMHGGKPVAGTSLLVYPPDREFLELQSNE
jgi:hypothetical protein